MEKLFKVLAVVFVMALVLGITGTKSVKTGEIGIVSTFGKVTATRPAGLAWRVPLIQRMTKIKVSQDSMSASYDVSTSDMQSVITDVTVQFTVDPAEAITLYTKFGGDYVESIVKPSISEAVNAATAHFTIEELVEKRVELSNNMQTLAEERLDEYGIRVLAVDITDHKFSDQYNKAVEAKKAAQQKTEESKEKLKQAELAAKRYEVTSKTYTTANFLNDFLEKWDGKMPQVVGGETNVLFDGLKDLPSGE